MTQDETALAYMVFLMDGMVQRYCEAVPEARDNKFIQGVFTLTGSLFDVLSPEQLERVHHYGTMVVFSALQDLLENGD